MLNYKQPRTKIVFIILLIGAVSIIYPQKSTKKYNRIFNRYDIILSDGTKCKEKYNKTLNRWETICPNEKLITKHSRLLNKPVTRSSTGLSYTKKWNVFLNRYNIKYKDGYTCWEKYNKTLKRWESNCNR